MPVATTWRCWPSMPLGRLWDAERQALSRGTAGPIATSPTACAVPGVAHDRAVAADDALVAVAAAGYAPIDRMLGEVITPCPQATEGTVSRSLRRRADGGVLQLSRGERTPDGQGQATVPVVAHAGHRDLVPRCPNASISTTSVLWSPRGGPLVGRQLDALGTQRYTMGSWMDISTMVARCCGRPSSAASGSDERRRLEIV